MSAPLKVFPKDPDAVLNYTVDWSAWLGADTIATSTWAVPTGITKNSDNHTTTTTTAVLSAGTDGSDYDLVNRITTAGGLTDDRTIRIQVRQQ